MQVDTKFIERRDEAQDIKTFVFQKPADFVYTAGQYAHFDLHKLTHPDERGPSHHFSLSSSPTEDFISFTTKIRPESGYKQTIMELTPGEMIMVRGPKGFFVLDDEHTTTSQLMIAGGIGIAPFRSILTYVSTQNLTVPIRLIYSAQTPAEFAFKNQLDAIVASHQNIQILYTITKPELSTAPWTGQTGRVNADMIKSLALDVHAASYWLCGPPQMVEGMMEILKELQISPDSIKTERFTGY